jgi:uncharacterized protein YggE
LPHVVTMKLLLFVLFALPIAVFAQGGLPNQPYIYVEGKAEIEKPADMVTLRFDLVARNADQLKANQEVQSKAARILAMLDERKIEQNDVIAGDLKSEPQYEDNDAYQKRGKIIGYSVTRPFSVKMRDVTIFPKLVDELVGLGVEFSGIDAGLSKEKEMQDEVWDKALLNARERAERAVKATGMKLDSIFALSPVSFPEIQARIFGATPLSASYARDEVKRPDPTQYRLAPVTIGQSIHVIYLISPAK